jgi:hypothetical protein
MTLAPLITPLTDDEATLCSRHRRAKLQRKLIQESGELDTVDAPSG